MSCQSSYAYNPYATSGLAASPAPSSDNTSGQFPSASETASCDGTSAAAYCPSETSSVAGGFPSGTLHYSALGDAVRFVPYPDEEFSMPHDAIVPSTDLDAPKGSEDELVRAFIGQLPYFVTDMQLAWLCYTFGGLNTVIFPERIMKRQPSGDRLPTGCVHAYATRRAVSAMAEGMHKRLLIDDTGVWVAQTKDQLIALDTYVTAMKRDKSLRVPHRPYDSVVVQFATSTYIPKHVASRKSLANTTTTNADVPVSPSARTDVRVKLPQPRRVQQQQQQYAQYQQQYAPQYYGDEECEQPQQPVYNNNYHQQQQHYGSYAAQQYNDCYQQCEPQQSYGEPMARQWPTQHYGAAPADSYQHQYTY